MRLHCAVVCMYLLVRSISHSLYEDGDASRLLGSIHVVAVATWNLKGRRKGRGFLLLLLRLTFGVIFPNQPWPTNPPSSTPLQVDLAAACPARGAFTLACSMSLPSPPSSTRRKLEATLLLLAILLPIILIVRRKRASSSCLRRPSAPPLPAFLLA